MNSENKYHYHSRPELVAVLPNNSDNRVLDLGCGAGAMSTLIRKQNKAKEIWGIEKFSSAAEQARKTEVFDRILEGDAERVIEELPNDYFSHVIAGDILEHLVDPWSICTRLHASLASGGMFICSIPNIRNLSFILKLTLGGRFEYKDSGVMDRTHLRFFARKNIQDLFSDAGFVDISIGPVRPKNKITWRIGKAIFGDLAIKGFLVTAYKP